MDISKKMDKFWEGFFMYVPQDIMLPAGNQRPGESKVMTWQERCEPLSIFECKALGEREGQAYALILEECRNE